MDSTKLSEFKVVIDRCKSDPSLIFTPSLSFLREYIESFGTNIPSGAYEEEDEIVESDVELEGDIVEPDNDPPQTMGDSSVEVTDENREAAQEAKGKAMEALSEGKFDEAINHLTQAITLNPTSAIMYGNRASVYIKLKMPDAAIHDANTALEINPNSANGYKARGMARAMLEEWEEAAKDLHLASAMDYDEEICAELKKVCDRLPRRTGAQAAYEEQSSSSRPSGGGFPGGMPGGFPRDGPGGFQGDGPGGFPGDGHGGFPGDGPGGFPGDRHGGFPGDRHDGFPEDWHRGFPGDRHDRFPRDRHDRFPEDWHRGFPGDRHDRFPRDRRPGYSGGMPGAGGLPSYIDVMNRLNDPGQMSAFYNREMMAGLQDVMRNFANFPRHDDM